MWMVIWRENILSGEDGLYRFQVVFAGMGLVRVRSVKGFNYAYERIRLQSGPSY